MCPKLNGAAGKLGLAAASIGLTLLVLEGLVRLLAPQGQGKEERSIALYTQHDPLLGWRKRPGARTTLHRRDYTVEVAINSRGLRDLERTYESPAFRILALGDSFVEGYSVPLEATVTRVLEASLSRPDCPVEALNGGSAAWSTDQELLFYRSDGARYGSKIVALFFYFNDVLFNDCDHYFGNPKPRFVVGSDGSLTLTGVPVPAAPSSAGAEPPSEPEPEGGSALLTFTANRLRIGVPRVYNRLAALGLWRPVRPVPPHEQFLVYKRHPPPKIRAAWITTAAILHQLAHEVRDHGARFVVVYVPSRMEISDRDWELTQLRFGIEPDRWDRGAVIASLRTAVADDAPVLDLTPALRRAEGFFQGPYYVDDGHWNPRGHRVAAAELESFLRREGWLPPCTLALRQTAAQPSSFR